MHCISIIKGFVVLATVTLTLSAGLPSRNVRSLDNIQPAVFHGEINGRAYELTGTSQEVWAQLKERHPDLELPTPVVKKDSPTSTLSIRAPVNKDGLICYPVPGWNWGQALSTNALDCSYSLYNQGRITISAHSCSLICCQGGDSVWLCNDNNYSINPAAQYLASYVIDIVDSCEEGWSDNGNWVAGGQEFDSDNYNIIVRGNIAGSGGC